MAMVEMTKFGSVFRSFLCLLTVSAFFVMSVADAEAQRRQDNEEEEDDIDRTMSSEVGEQVLEANILLSPADDTIPPDYRGAITLLNAALPDASKPYDFYIIYRLRGVAYYNTENYQGAVDDFVAAINSGAVTQEEANALRQNVGQIYILLEDFREGIRQLEIALNNGLQLAPGLARLMSQAYAQLDDWQGGLRYAEFFYENTPERTAGDFSLMQAFYQRLDRSQDEFRVVRDRLNALPGEETAWQNYVSLLARLGREEDAFEANKMMYLNGLFACEDGNRLLNLAQYYSYYEVPYRGASLLQREINAGCVEESVDNLETLANMWRQAAEFDNSIPVLERISEIRGDGDTALKLAEAHYQLNNFGEAATWYERALNRGGLDQTGAAWVQLGTVRVELDNLQGALDAFREGARFPNARRSANDWITFTEGQIRARINRAIRQDQVQIDECRLILEAEADIITLVGNASDFNEFGQVIVDVPDNCTRWFNENVVQIRGPQMSDEEAAAFAEEQLEIARRQAEQAMARAG